MIRVLFVCLGNVCRSPSAEAVFRSAVERAGRAAEFELDSAGTGGHFAGHPPDERAVAAGARRGLRVEGTARQVRFEDLERFDYVLAMDEQNLADLQALARRGQRDASGSGPGGVQLALVLGDREVLDPFYGGPAGFERVLDLLEAAAEAWLARVKTR